MRYPELNAHIVDSTSDGGCFAPLYVLYGDDAFLLNSAVNAFRNTVAPEYADFNFAKLSAAKGLADIIEALNTFPLFDERKIVVADGFADKLSEMDNAALKSYLANPNPGAVLVAVFGDTPTKPLIKAKGAVFVDCDRLQGDELSFEIKKILDAPPSRAMEKTAEQELATITGGDLNRIFCELQKLKSYAEQVISLTDVIELVTPDTEYQIYELSNAVSEKNGEKALKTVDSFIKNGMKPSHIISSLSGKYRNMLHVELHKTEPNDVIAKALGVKPGAVYKIKTVSCGYTQTRLKKAVDLLHGLQCDVQSGRRQETSALSEAVIELLSN